MTPVRDAKQEERITVFLLAQNRLLREALARALARHSDIDIVGVACHEPSVYETIRQSKCDVLLTDRMLTASLAEDLWAGLSAPQPGPKVLFFGMPHDVDRFFAAVRAGASAYLLEDATAAETVAAVKVVATGGAVCPGDLCRELFDFVARTTREGQAEPKLPLFDQRLTPRQKQVVTLISRGLTNKEIASAVNLSEFTIKNHVRRIMRQLNVGNRYDAVEAAHGASR